jgi:hypothetical protein
MPEFKRASRMSEDNSQLTHPCPKIDQVGQVKRTDRLHLNWRRCTYEKTQKNWRFSLLYIFFAIPYRPAGWTFPYHTVHMAKSRAVKSNRFRFDF